MCKIMIIPKVINKKLAEDFLKAARPYMAEGDPHGLGYAALNEDGTLSGERWLNPADAFRVKNVKITREFMALLKIKSALNGDFRLSGYNSFGDLNKNWTSVLYHTRFATCEINLNNVHPFVKKDTALIHNGVIQNPENFGSRQSTCDSEAILNAYLDNKVNDLSDNFQLIANKLIGYYAIGVISKNSDSQFILDIIKDNTAKLECMYIEKLDTVVYCTSSSIIKKACIKLKWKYNKSYSIKDNTLIRYNAISGDLFDILEFDLPKTKELNVSFRDYDMQNFIKNESNDYIEFEDGRIIEKKGL